jgi:hypothetical protein
MKGIRPTQKLANKHSGKAYLTNRPKTANSAHEHISMESPVTPMIKRRVFRKYMARKWFIKGSLRLTNPA